MSYDKIKTNTALVDVMMHLSGNKQSLLLGLLGQYIN